MSQLDSWRADLASIREEVTQLAWSAATHGRLREIVSANPDINVHNQFYGWLSRSYVDSQLMGIRRQLDRDKRSVSLANLIASMEGASGLLTREAHLSLYRESMERPANRTFDLLAGKGDDVYPAARLRGALRALEQVRAVHGKYMNKRLAHLDRGPLEGRLPTYRDLSTAVGKLEKLVIHYHLLFEAEDYRSLVPVVQYDWEAIFRQAWLPPRLARHSRRDG
ncbi:MAG: hypothetical protein WAM82_09855 [Thermoanaerobaculia bacterium]